MTTTNSTHGVFFIPAPLFTYHVSSVSSELLYHLPTLLTPPTDTMARTPRDRPRTQPYSTKPSRESPITKGNGGPLASRLSGKSQNNGTAHGLLSRLSGKELMPRDAPLKNMVSVAELGGSASEPSYQGVELLDTRPAQPPPTTAKRVDPRISAALGLQVPRSRPETQRTQQRSSGLQPAQSFSILGSASSVCIRIDNLALGTTPDDVKVTTRSPSSLVPSLPPDHS